MRNISIVTFCTCRERDADTPTGLISDETSLSPSLFSLLERIHIRPQDLVGNWPSFRSCSLFREAAELSRQRGEIGKDSLDDILVPKARARLLGTLCSNVVMYSKGGIRWKICSFAERTSEMHQITNLNRAVNLLTGGDGMVLGGGIWCTMEAGVWASSERSVVNIFLRQEPLFRAIQKPLMHNKC